MGLTDIGSERVVTLSTDEDVVAVDGQLPAKKVLRCDSGVVEGLQQVAAQVEQVGLTDIESVRGSSERAPMRTLLPSRATELPNLPAVVGVGSSNVRSRLPLKSNRWA